MEISERLKKARINADVSLSELSKKTGIAKSTLQRYEAGTTKKIPLEAITKIEVALSLPFGELMGMEVIYADPQDEELVKIALQLPKPEKLPDKFQPLCDVLCQSGYYIQFCNGQYGICDNNGFSAISQEELDILSDKVYSYAKFCVDDFRSKRRREQWQA